MFDGSNPYFSLLYLREKNTLPNGTVSKTQIPPEADELKLASGGGRAKARVEDTDRIKDSIFFDSIFFDSIFFEFIFR